MAGRPLKFKSPEELEAKINEYYKWAQDNKKKITVTGLAWYLGTSKQCLLLYQKESDELLKSVPDDVKAQYRQIITKAKAKIESEYEQLLFDRNTAVGAIFALKNCFKWTDKVEIEQTNKTIEVSLED